MTIRLYYADSLLTAFDACVLESGAVAGRPFVVLDRTAFYPTTGGQPHDTGTLGGRHVVDVIDREHDGAVLHVVDAALEVGAVVSGEIDWKRRLDHMQQHTGQHVLSAAFVRLFQIPTVSFHLGGEASTIDLAGAAEPGVIARAEDEANRVVWEDRPVRVRFVSPEEAAELPLRKEPVRTGTLRVIDVEDFDLSACGGTHVARTGVIGIIAVQGWERYKGGTRVAFVCGRRGLKQFRTYRDIVGSVVRQLSIQPGELPDAVTRLRSESRDARAQLKALSEQLASYEADTMAEQAETVADIRLLCRVIDGRDAAALKSLAQAIVTRPGHCVALVSAARPAAIVIARSADARMDAAQVVRTLTARLGGKGGGRPELAQAGGVDADSEVLRAAAYELLSGGLPPSSSDSR